MWGAGEGGLVGVGGGPSAVGADASDGGVAVVAHSDPGQSAAAGTLEGRAAEQGMLFVALFRFGEGRGVDDLLPGGGWGEDSLGGTCFVWLGDLFCAFTEFL